MGMLELSKPQIITNAGKGLILAKNTIIKQSPIILSASAVAGVVTTVMLASKASLKADEIIKEKELEKGEDLTMTEKVQVAWKPYVPTIISASLTIGSIVGACVINEKRKAALAGLLALSETALKEYQDKVAKEFGPKAEQKVRDAINQDKVADDVPPWEEDVMPAGKVLMKDALSGRMFVSTVDKVKRVAADLNQRMLCGDYCASLNEFYDDLCSMEIGAIKLGEDCGWNIQHLCRPYFTAGLTSDMRPILVLDWEPDGRPISTYRDI